MDDLRRWAALDQLETNPYQIEGMKFWGTVYDKSAGVNPLNLKDSDGADATVIVDVAGGTGNMSDPAISGPYVHPYQISKNIECFDGYKWIRAQYLYPLGQAAFRKTATELDDKGTVVTSVVYQNPGWSMIGGEAPTAL